MMQLRTLALKPRDVVIEEKRVEVLRGKGSKPRTVYFRSDELGILLERWKELRPRSEYLFSTVRSASGKGERLDPRGFRITFKSYVKKAGLDPNRVTPHVLRHTCATEMLRRGVNIRVIQEALGHAWVATTQVYTHVVNEDVRRAMTSSYQEVFLVSKDKPSLLAYIENADEDFDLASEEYFNIWVIWSEAEPDFVELVNEPGLPAPVFDKPEGVTSVSFRVVSLSAEIEGEAIVLKVDIAGQKEMIYRIHPDEFKDKKKYITGGGSVGSGQCP